MHECLLCRRNMKVSGDIFGNGCVRNIYSFLNLKMPKKVKIREETLYRNIMKINNINSINTNQKIWLTDRYLTYQYINGKKVNDKWNLEIKLHDIYDYSVPKNLIKYYNDTSSIAKSLLSSTLYNLASFSTKCGVMKEYEIEIQIYIEGFEVI